MIKHIPIYYYQNNVQKLLTTLDLIIDSEFVQKYAAGYNYSWSGIEETSLRKLINNHLGYSLINDDVGFITGLDIVAIPKTNILQMNELTDYHIVYANDLSRDNTSYGYNNMSAKTLNNCIVNNADYATGYIIPNSGGTLAKYMHSNSIVGNYHHVGFDPIAHSVWAWITVFSDDLFDGDNKSVKVTDCLVIEIAAILNNDHTKITSASISINYRQDPSSTLYNAFEPVLNLNNAQDYDYDNNNPYAPYDDPYTGGGGDYGDPDDTDPTDVPALPTVGASDFITIYGPTSAQLQSLSSFLWSADNIFNVNNFKKIYNDPSEVLIGLNILPCEPTSSGSKNIKFGNIDTSVSSKYYTSQWVEVDCGSKYIQSLADSFMDYSPMVKCQIFLPYIGFQHLNIDDIINASIQVIYHVDVVSGDLVAFIKHSKKGVIYSFSGNCLATIPMTGSSYGTFLNKYYSGLAQVIPNMGGGAVAGGAAGAATAGAMGLYNTAETVMFDRKASYSRSGSMSGAAAIMGVQKPFMIIERPNVSVPNNVEAYAGLSSNKTMSLGSCSGFTQVEFVHIDGVSATAGEIAEIESLLKQGVIL